MDEHQPTIVSPVAVRPRYEDLPPFAYQVTTENIPDIGATLGLNAVVRDGVTVLEIPFEWRFGLSSYAEAGDYIIRHPMNTRHLEVVPGRKMWNVYETRTAGADLDELVRAEVPTCTAWAIIADTPDGVGVFPGRGIQSPTHLIGIAYTVATRFSQRGS